MVFKKNADVPPVGEAPSSPGPLASNAFAADLLRGHTDTIVLGVLRGSDGYGFEIHKAIRDATGGEPRDQGSHPVRDVPPAHQGRPDRALLGRRDAGRPRKYYRITDAGRAVFRRNVDDWLATQKIINTLLDLKEGRA